MPKPTAPTDGAALVTGASSGLGRGVALELARCGWRVFALARRADELAKLATEARGLKGSIIPATADVTDREALAAFIAKLDSQDPIALAFLNAGGNFNDPPGVQGGEGWTRTLDLNLNGLVNAYAPLLTAMRGRSKGQIALMASLAGYVACRSRALTGRARRRR